jgi:hypothetical protein
MPSQPKGVGTFVERDPFLWNAGACDAMVVIATGDEIAVDLLAPAALRVAQPRSVVIEIMDRKVLGLPDDAVA